jgi:site-specific DNA-methyltransferase (adenine-specific)
MPTIADHTEVWPIERLIHYANNPRVNEHAVGPLASVIKEFGFKVPIIAKSDGTVVDGHLRLKVAHKLGITEVPVVLADDLTDAQIKAFRIAVNKMADIPDWDYNLLAVEFEQLQELDFDLSLTGFEVAEIDEIFAGDEPKEGLTDPDEVPEPPAEPTTKPGDLFSLGGHRLICGHSTAPAVVERLMGGEKADMVFTDPPYGVSYVGKTKDALTIDNDAHDSEGLADFIAEVFDTVSLVARPGAYVLATVPPGPQFAVFCNDFNRREWWRQTLVWNKDSMVLGHSEYHYKHEAILFGWIPGGDRLKNSDRTKTTVWDFDRPKASREHPTMKPVEMWNYGIENHTKGGDKVLDPFGGSGTTILACEQMGRSGRLVELDPIYCDVIVKRWEDFTGKKAELIDG